MKTFALGLLVLCCALPFAGASAQKKQKKEPCDDARTQLDMNVCADREFKNADAALNRLYNQLMAQVDEDGKAKIKSVELAWLKYRDSNCDYEASVYEGGSIKPMIYSFCLARMTQARTSELKDQIKELNH